MTEEEFRRRLLKAGERAWIGRGGVELLARMVEKLREIPGDIIECGSYRGGSAMGLALAAQFYPPNDRSGSSGNDFPKTVYAFDTFEGTPEVSEIDRHHAGDFSDVQYEEVTEASRQLSNLRLVKGEFKFTVPIFQQRPVSFLFLDCDLYESTRLCLEKFWPWVTKGGVAICEDYMTPSCPGATKAVDEFRGCQEIEWFDAWRGLRKI